MKNYLLFTIAALLASTTATANTIEVIPHSSHSTVGSIVSVDLVLDFTESTLGGGVDLYYAAALRWTAFDFDAALPDDPNLRFGPGFLGGQAPMIIGFGSLAGIAGRHTIGTATFEVLALGHAWLQVLGNSNPVGPFVSPAAQQLAVTYGSAGITVPEPAVTTLLGILLCGAAFLGQSLPSRQNRAD